MNFPENLRYTKDHEWILLEGDIATVGITDFAQHELGAILFTLKLKQKENHWPQKQSLEPWKR